MKYEEIFEAFRKTDKTSDSSLTNADGVCVHEGERAREQGPNFLVPKRRRGC